MQKPFAIMLWLGDYYEGLKLKISDAYGKGLRKYYDNDKQYKSLKDNASSKVRVRK